MKNKLSIAVTVLALASLFVTGCQKGDLLSNPNAATEATPIPVSLILNHLTANFIRGEETPFGGDQNGANNAYKTTQMQVANYSKYWGNNEYGWSYSGHSYEILKYAIQLEKQASAQFGNTTNKYYALAKFFRAYSAIWLSQRVGDIPMTQAGDPIAYPTPAFDTQKDVYKNSLTLLEDANTMFAALNNASTNNLAFDGGDIFNLSNLQWQKLINTYKLRLLISLSKRADDNADLNIKAQFNAMVTNPAKYPVMTANADNMVYKFNSTNQYPNFQLGNTSYNNFMNVSKTVLDITTANKDPRTYLMATPAPKLIAGGKTIGDFTAYVGADPKLSLSALQTSSDGGNLSYFNALRYFGSNTGAAAEPFIFIGYPELCFNIAEGINRGWAAGLTATDAKAWYDKGIAASFSNFGLNVSTNSTVAISNLAVSSQGNVVTDNATFLANVAYNTGSSTAALTQILQQKFVAFFLNSGFEAFYNYRRTGIPAFSDNGPGIGTTNSLLPKRWLYTLEEINYNNANYKTSIGSQYGGADDINGLMWLVK